MHPPGRHRARRATLLAAARRSVDNNASTGSRDFADLYVIKVRQQPANELITPSTQRWIMMNIDHSLRDRTPFSPTKPVPGNLAVGDLEIPQV